MRSAKPSWPFPPRKSEDPEPSLAASIWDSITHSGLRAVAMRYAGHMLILLIVALGAWLARSSLLELLPARIEINPTLQKQSPTPAFRETALLPESSSGGPAGYVSRAINFTTYLPDHPRSDVVVYTVASGDTLFGIAQKFNIKPETIFWSNQNTLKDNPDLLTPGMELFILPVDGVYYQWQDGNQLDAVAERFKANMVDIISWPGNHLDADVDPKNPKIPAGTWLIIPGGSREFVQWQIPILRRTDQMRWAWGGPGACQGPYLSSAQGSGYFVWPTDGRDTSRGNPYCEWHHAIDISLQTGDNVYASDSGVVVFSGWSTWGYGNLIVVDHGNGWQTVYAHLSVVYAGCGFDVYRGEVIGLGGSTGNSTGPHLHFEMRSEELGLVNPLNYLP
ncbi:MAG: peptidoglycan DD-metalloendopeptidase family protein [Anaerolineales bacterium]|nr:peptidoglycan DD-metalloendopeptidase family protein [Anaerolineales bacterium]